MRRRKQGNFVSTQNVKSFAQLKYTLECWMILLGSLPTQRNTSVGRVAICINFLVHVLWTQAHDLGYIQFSQQMHDRQNLD